MKQPHLRDRTEMLVVTQNPDGSYNAFTVRDTRGVREALAKAVITVDSGRTVGAALRRRLRG